MVLKRPCLACGTRTRGSRCDECSRRRDSIRNAGLAQRARCPSITRTQRRRVYARDGYACVDCGACADLTLDHAVPLALEPKPRHRDDELVIRCRSCNSRRGACAAVR